eukprot:5247378-Lingulodinium_polyedra.AAC.1
MDVGWVAAVHRRRARARVRASVFDVFFPAFKDAVWQAFASRGIVPVSADTSFQFELLEGVRRPWGLVRARRSDCVGETKVEAETAPGGEPARKRAPPRDDVDYGMRDMIEAAGR